MPQNKNVVEIRFATPCDACTTPTKYSGMNETSPRYTVERTIRKAVRRKKPDQSSGMCCAEPFGMRFGMSVRMRDVSRNSTTDMIATGIAVTNVPVMPYVAIATAANAGPVANPMLPPTANQRMPDALREPAARFAKRAASGWNIATPRPLINAHTKISAYDGMKPMPATPKPASSNPRPASHGIGRLSAM